MSITVSKKPAIFRLKLGINGDIWNIRSKKIFLCVPNGRKMYRNSIKSLKDWKKAPDRKPLIFLGARQVGKTWLIKEFGKTEYRQTAYINFEHPNAPEYHVAAAGSLLGINLHHDESFPVGKVDFLKLYPMSFVEFLKALKEDDLSAMIETRDMTSLNFFHEKLITLLRYYFFVGGMPEAVKKFVETRDWSAVRKIQEAILQSYQSDFSKHAPTDIVPRINMVWESIPAQLAKENKKFIYGIIREGARAKDYEVAIQRLTDCGLLHKINNVSKSSLPLAAYKDLSAFKLYHNDIGLLGAMTGVSAISVVDGDLIMTEFKGAMAEQFVFQQLLSRDDLKISYHTFDNSKYEVDFLLQTSDDEIIPLEVKSGESVRVRSFNIYCKKNSPKRAYRASLKPYHEESWMTNIPLYAISALQ